MIWILFRPPAENPEMSIATSSPDIELIPSLAQAPSHDHTGHVVQLYTDDGFLIDVLSRFVGGALAAGDPAVVIATTSHRTELERRLSVHGLDTAKAAMQGRYVNLDATETLPKIMVNGLVDEIRFDDSIGGVWTRAGKPSCHEERAVAGL